MNFTRSSFKFVLVVAAAAIGMAAAALPAYAAPCCQIIAINTNSGVVTAKVNANNQPFEFRLSNPAQLPSLRAGQPIYANLSLKEVSLDGVHVVGAIIAIGSAPPSVHLPGIGGLANVQAPVRTGHIVSLSGGNANVQVDGSDAALQFGPRPQDLAYLEPHQKVWIREARSIPMGGPRTAGPTILYLPWPQSLQRKDDLGHSHYMDTKVVISNNGRIDGTTKTWSSEELRGFTGGVVILLESDQCNSQGDCEHLYMSPKPHRYGVNGHSMGSSSRTDLWSETVTPDVLAQTRHIKIIQLESAEDRLDKFLADAKSVADIAASVVKVGQAIAGAAGGQ